MHEDFQRFRASFLPDLNLSPKKKKKKLYNVSLLSERQGFIAFALYLDQINNNLISIWNCERKRFN